MKWPFRAELAGLSAYQPEVGEAAILLDANESPWGPPAEFMQEATRAIAGLDLNRYPDSTALRLRRAAAKVYGVDLKSVLPGNGSDELIGILLTALGGEGSRLLVPVPTFSMYALAAKTLGWQVDEVPLDGGFDLGPDFVEAARKSRPKLIILAWPNNPTGNCFSRERIEELLDIDDCTVVVDEAYAEFSGYSFTDQVGKRENLVVLRTLSKAYGLAGLRCGFLLATAAFVGELEKVRMPYNVNAISQLLGSMALEQNALFRQIRVELLVQRDRLVNGLGDLGFEVFASDSNFVLVRHAQAEKVKVTLLKSGIRIRSFKGSLESYLRINAGTEEETTALLNGVAKALGMENAIT